MGVLLAREGFSGLGVNAVAREAGVDKVLLYRYFGGIEELLEAWGRVALAAPTAPAAPARRRGASAGDAPRRGPSLEAVADRAVAALLEFTHSVRKSPQALEIMRWELFEENPLTRRLADLRESAGLAQLARFDLDEELARELDVPALTAVLSAGLLHLALRARSAPCWLDVPIRTAQGWERLERAVATLVHAALSTAARGRRRAPGQRQPATGGDPAPPGRAAGRRVTDR